MTKSPEGPRSRLTIGRIMLGIAIVSFPMAIARREPILSVTVALCVLGFGLIRALIRKTRHEVERGRRGPDDPG